MVLCTITTLISKGSTDWDVLVLDLSTMTTLIFKYIYPKFVFSVEVFLQCLHPFLLTYSQNMSSVKFSHTWCCYNDYIDFQRITSLRCFGPGFVYNVCVVFDTYIVETQAGSAYAQFCTFFAKNRPFFAKTTPFLSKIGFRLG